MKLINFTGEKVGTSATLTYLDTAKKQVHLVIDGAHAEYNFEGDALDVKLLSKLTISADGTVSVAGTTTKAKSAVKEKSGATGSSPAFNKHY